MNDSSAAEHYDRLAAAYDQNWAYSPAFLEWMTGCVLTRLRPAPGETAADIGCGTGLYSRGLALHADAVTCADPSAAMLAQVPASDRITAVTASAEDIAAGRAALPGAPFGAILLKEVLHHVTDRAAVIAGLARILRPGGRILVVMLPATIAYPLFRAALERFEAGQPDPEEIAAAMREAGLAAEVTYESFQLTFPAEKYLRMVRDRYMSLLSSFTDAEIEAGVAEIRRDHPGPEITFPDRFAFVLGTAR